MADEIWERFGNVPNYVEPFFGSGAVLLARPHDGKTETVNDVDHLLANFWRAVQWAPDEVARHADWIVSEVDLQARHYWLITEGRERVAACSGDAAHYDAQVAGWWLWGACAWIGSGWCDGDGPWAWNGTEWVAREGGGINRQLMRLSGAQGINRDFNRQLPHMSSHQGINRKLYIESILAELSERLRDVRIACGDWSRVCGDSVTWRNGLTGVFMDPPYSMEGRAKVYSNDCADVASQARVWAIEAGKRDDMRIAFCGYDGEHEFPADWSIYRWKAAGGYGGQGNSQGRENSERETLWFSPACNSARQGKLF